VQEFRALKQKKAKVGRPKLPKGEAKGRIVPVRLDVEDVKLITVAAKREGILLSEWIRNALRTRAEASMSKHTLHDAMRIVLSESPDYCANTQTICEAINNRDLYERGDRKRLEPWQVELRARKYLELFEFTEPKKLRLLGDSVATPALAESL
jgi:uncharacterized protein (DUF1778 family)